MSQHRNPTRAKHAVTRERPRRSITNYVLVVVALGMVGVLAAPYLSGRGAKPSLATPDFAIVKTYPHDPAAFTQGLAWHGGFIYEGTGQFGQSSIRKTSLETGEVQQSENLEFTRFGEGIAIRDDEIIQLTWQAGIGYVRDLETFAVRSRSPTVF